MSAKIQRKQLLRAIKKAPSRPWQRSGTWDSKDGEGDVTWEDEDGNVLMKAHFSTWETYMVVAALLDHLDSLATLLEEGDPAGQKRAG